MKKIYNYKRISRTNRIHDRIFDLGNAGSFTEIRIKLPEPPDECSIEGTSFRSVHIIKSWNDSRIFTAYRSSEYTDILLIVWEEYPFYPHIEEGGDFMLQVLASDKAVKHLIIDNTYVRSGWMDEKMSNYLNNGWFPGLVELGLEAFCHLQAESYLGELSFKSFGELVSGSISDIAQNLDKKPFAYFPVKTSEMSQDGRIDADVRNIALKKALDIIKSL